MFNKSNFCHIASNNRNEQKGSVFIYKTADTLAQVTQSGYFNEKLIDINLHDLIIHVQYDPVARTLKKSVLIVTERTLDNVETAPILDQTIGDDIDQLGDQVAGIEEKIPGAASAANQLADKAFVKDIKTAIETTIAGINTSISTLNNDLSQTNQNLAQTNQNVNSLQETKQDKATAVNYGNIANCITEVPQDIKLELNNGTLTLKAGSKVYIPNGSGVFDEITLASDASINGSGWSGTMLIAYDSVNGLHGRLVSNCTSGSGATATDGYAYDTSANTIKFYNANGQVQYTDCSFPIAEYDTSNSEIKVFNGFGYIGSTVFALPGIKGLIPDSRNADGTLKNIEFTTSIVRTIGYPGASYSNYKLGLSDTHLDIFPSDKLEYQEDVNKNYNNQSSNYEPLINAGYISSNGSTITSFTPKLPFHAVDYSDFKPVQDHSLIAFQKPTADNGYTWYRKYADGWVEQGTSYVIAGGNAVAITLPVPMNSTIYNISLSQYNGDTSAPNLGRLSFYSQTATGFTVISRYTSSDVARSFMWKVCGMAA